jgi:hypothetical protein
VTTDASLAFDRKAMARRFCFSGNLILKSISTGIILSSSPGRSKTSHSSLLFIVPSLLLNPSSSSNLPLYILHTNLLPRLLIIIKPLPFTEVNFLKLRSALRARSKPLAVCLELGKLETAAVNFDDISSFRCIGLRIGVRRSGYGGRVLTLQNSALVRLGVRKERGGVDYGESNLTIPTAPDEVCFTAGAAEFVLILTTLLTFEFRCGWRGM